jgi:hypothetical protein
MISTYKDYVDSAHKHISDVLDKQEKQRQYILQEIIT